MSGNETHAQEALQSFFEQNLVHEVVAQLKSGKEATVFHCRGTPASGHRNVCAKVYHEQSKRSFRNDAVYRAGRLEYAHNTRIRRALEKNTSFGKMARHRLWVEAEWITLCALAAAGVDCPLPLAQGSHAILMSFVGDDDGPAPQLRGAHIEASQVRPIAQTLLEQIARMLDAHCVHGDLSPYNILLWDNRPTIIDFPQAIDPRLNPAAAELLFRDVSSICDWATSHGSPIDAGTVFSGLWTDFLHGRIG